MTNKMQNRVHRQWQNVFLLFFLVLGLACTSCTGARDAANKGRRIAELKKIGSNLLDLAFETQTTGSLVDVYAASHQLKLPGNYKFRLADEATWQDQELVILCPIFDRDLGPVFFLATSYARGSQRGFLVLSSYSDHFSFDNIESMREFLKTDRN